MLERESAFYQSNRAEYREKYLDKWLVITGELLWGVYETLAEAAKAALAQLEPGEFMIHRPADDNKVIEAYGPFIRFRSPGSDKESRPNPVMIYSGGSHITIPYASK